MKRSKKLSLWFLFLLLPVFAVAGFVAFAPVTFINTVTPSFSFTKTTDVVYGELPRHKMDIYAANSPKTNAPMLVFVHGGGWRNGDKSMYKFLAEGFTKDGYDIAVPNYRLFPDGVYPNMLLDTAKAVAHVARTYPDRPLILIGHSAGAYNVMMMALTPDYLSEEGVDVCRRVAGVISLAGPTGEIKLTSPRYVAVIPDRFNGASAAIHNLDNPSPPLLVANGGLDEQVDPINAVGLVQRMEDKGKAVRLKLYESHTHNDLVKFLSRHFEKDSTLKSDLTAFIDGQSQSGDFCQ